MCDHTIDVDKKPFYMMRDQERYIVVDTDYAAAQRQRMRHRVYQSAGRDTRTTRESYVSISTGKTKVGFSLQCMVGWKGWDVAYWRLQASAEIKCEQTTRHTRVAR